MHIAVVVPAHNEETQITNVVLTMPEFVDKIIIVNDCSQDKTQHVVTLLQAAHPRVVLINHEINHSFLAEKTKNLSFTD